MADAVSFTKDEALSASQKYFSEYHGHDEEGAKLPASVFVDKYALRDNGGALYETTPNDMHYREANELARVEAQYPNAKTSDQIFERLHAFNQIVLQGSPSFGVGNPYQLVSISNCAVVASPADTMSGIMNTARDMANLFKRRFGAGLDLGLLRPDGAAVNNAARTSTGSHSFMDFYSYVTRMVGQSGRRGALMLTMPISHPDVEKFVTKKSDKSLVTGANVSVRVTDDFMRAVENGESYTLQWPATGPDAKFTRTVDARDLFRLIAEQATANAEPGLLFWDTIQRNLPLDYYREDGFETLSTNPCGELPLSAHDSCRLLSLYLPGFVRHPFTDHAYFDFPAFREAVMFAQRLGDDLVDIELEKLREIQKVANTEDEKELFQQFINAAEMGRRTGLGTHGLGDMLAQMRYKYDSTTALYHVERVYHSFMLAAYRSSVEMAKERGPFPIYDPEVEKDCPYIQQIAKLDPQLYAEMVIYGRRNGSLLTLAPTGTISILSRNCSSGMEPMFMASYERNRKVDANKEDVTGLYRDQQGDYWRSYKVFHPNVQRFIDLAAEYPAKYGYNSTDALSIESRDERKAYIEKNLPDFFVGANEIDWDFRVRMQATITKYLDHSVSSTINLPQGTSVDTVEKIYMEAWKHGCKGVTVYVDGSREAQVLSSGAADAVAPTVEDIIGRDVSEILPEAVSHDETWVVDPLKALDYVASQADRVQGARLTPAQQDVVQNVLLPMVNVTDSFSRRTHRGLETHGKMKKATFRNVDGQERKVYVYVGLNENEQPVEVFVTDAGGNEDFLPYGAALGKLISLGLKFGVPANSIAEAMRGLKGGSISYSGKVSSSVPDLVAKLLDSAQTSFEEKAEEPDLAASLAAVDTLRRSEKIWKAEYQAFPEPGPNVPAPRRATPAEIFEKVVRGKGMTCPSCNGTNVRKVDGCPLCPECGWGKC